MAGNFFFNLIERLRVKVSRRPRVGERTALMNPEALASYLEGGAEVEEFIAEVEQDRLADIEALDQAMRSSN